MMPVRVINAALTLLLATTVFGCGSDDTDGDESASDSQATTADVGTDATSQDSATGDDLGVELDTETDPDVPDAPLEDSDEPGPDTNLDDTKTSGNKTLANYIQCDSDNDCPSSVGGTCAKDLPLLHAAPDGAQTVSVSTLSGGAITGLCLLTCTDNVGACDALTLVDSQDDPIVYTCQLVYAAPSPYPNAQALPFAVDAAAMETGIAFAAVCRPPFELDPAVPDSFCRPCSAADECQDGTCWNASTGEEPGDEESGVCLVPCETTTDCMFGFSCAEIAGQTEGQYCVPLEATCGACRDLDADGRGVGYCGPVGEPVTEVDCDDANASAYHNSAKPLHPFTDGANCGAHDYNCNGESDDTEVIGVAGHSQFHCAFCGDACGGDVAQGVKTCLGESGSAACGLVCATDTEGQLTHAHCDDDLDNGCETAVDDPANVFFPDTDEDGAGDKDVTGTFDCGGGLPAEDGPWVTNQADCNDENNAVYGEVIGGKAAALDVTCDGIDNDCDDVADDDFPTTTSCATDLPGACTDGLVSCADAQETCVPVLLVGAQTETCDAAGVDEDCDGLADADEPGGVGGIDGVGASCTVPGLLGTCALNNTMQCVGAFGVQCVAPDPSSEDAIADGVDTDCDGFDGVTAHYRFVSEIPKTVLGITSVGKEQLQSAIDDCATDLMCSGVVMSNEGTWVYGEAIVLRSGVSLYGGWDPSTGTFPDNESTKLLRNDDVDDTNRLIGLRAINIVKPTTLARVQVLVSDANGTVGTDVYGVQCHKCSGLSVGHQTASGPAGSVTISAGRGSIGAAGATQNGPLVAGGHGAFVTVAAQPGSDGATAGSNSPVGTLGGPGGPGAAGATGPGGGPPTLSCDGFLLTHSGAGGSAGESGGGGGRGGNTTCKCSIAGNFCDPVEYGFVGGSGGNGGS
ncbi:MAG: hypothetical protein ACI9OJ_000777, partial [Myxococcota bacterium]